MSDEENSYQALQHMAGDIAYYLPAEKFVYRSGGSWALNQPVGKEGILHHLQHNGLNSKDARSVIGAKAYPLAYGARPKPGAESIFQEGNKSYLNTYHPPTLQAAQGEYPTISRVIAHLTENDPTGAMWLMHWLAAKVQDPIFLPKVAVVLCTPPGAGKGTLAAVIREMMGPKNCVTIQGGELESRFNSKWADKLFVLADEVRSNNVKDVSNLLKVLIDGSEIGYEAKAEHQKEISNHLAWIFATNDRVVPVVVETGDRRYSVFSNFEPVTPEYKAILDGCYKKDRRTHTEAFSAEIAALYYDLLNLEVDRGLISAPYQNQTRERLIAASLPAQEMAFESLDKEEFDSLLDTALLRNGNFSLVKTKMDWDFGEKGVAIPIIYLTYKEFCTRVGMHPMGAGKFRGALMNHRRPDGTSWEIVTNTTPSGREVECCKVPRRNLKSV